jgi:hypothetical protein
MRKLLTCLLAGILAFNIFGGSWVQAAPTAEDARWVLISKLRGYKQALDNDYRGQYGLYLNLYYLALDIRWTEFLYDAAGNHGLEISENERESYRLSLIDDIKAFNLRYKSAPDSIAGEEDAFHFEKLELSVQTQASSFTTMVSDALDDRIPVYLEGRLKTILTAYDEAEASGIADADVKVIADNKDALRYIYKILEVLTSEDVEMLNVSPTGNVNVTSSVMATSMISADSLYIELLEKGKAIDAEESATIDNVAVIETGEYLERLSFVTKKTLSDLKESDVGTDLWSNDSVNPDSGFELRDTYLRMVAAGAVYQPFVSFIGDREYLEAMSGLFKEEDRQKALHLFDQIKDYRKPLYVVPGDSVNKYFKTPEDGVDKALEDYAGTARVATLENFLDLLKSGSLFGLVMMGGMLSQNKQDANTFAYFNDNPLLYTGSTSTIGGTDPTGGTSPDGGGDESAGIGDTPKVGGVNTVLSNAEETTTSTKWTPIVFSSGIGDLFGKYYHRAALTNITLTNYMQGISDLDSLSKDTKNMLFMNAFGDIVTQDNRVVFPGVANPMIYKLNTPYNPYTVTFMKGYPDVAFIGTKMSLKENLDKGKYMLMSPKESATGDSLFIKIKGERNFAIATPQIIGEVNLNLSEPLVGVNSSFTKVNGDNIFSEGFLANLWDVVEYYVGSGGLSANYKGLDLVQKEDTLMMDRYNVFNYEPGQDEDFIVARYIALNMYKSMVSAEGSDTGTSRVDHDFVFKNILFEGLSGTVYTSAYYKTMTQNYDSLMNDSFTNAEKIITDWGRQVVETFGDTDGVLGVKNSYNDPIFGKMLEWTSVYFWYIALVLVIVFVLMYLRNRATILYTVMMSGAALLVMFVFLRVIPVYLPMGYNFLLNNINLPLSYDILISKSEKYDKTYKNSNVLTPDGKFSINTTSIDLYRFTDEELDTALDQYGISRDEISGGNIYIVDSDNGIYLEGNSLKANIDVLFYTNPVVGAYEDSPAGTIYQLTASKQYSSVIDYYMPYYLIQDGLVDSMNRLLQAFIIPKQTIQYVNGMSKDGFLYYHYTNSPPFLTPADYEQSDTMLMPEQVDKLYYLFDNPDTQTNSYDFLNLDRLLSNPTPEMADSLWYRSMMQNKKLPVDEGGETRYWDMISSVNLLTKKFMLELQAEVGLISDENLIKVTSLYATTIFNQKISSWGNQVYPLGLNYQEYKYSDVMLSSVTRDFRRFLAADMDVSSYVVDQRGVLGGLLLIANMVLGRTISEITKIGLPVMYILFILLFAIRFVIGTKISTVVKGYLKISVLLFISLTIFVASLGLLRVGNLMWVLIAMFFIYVLIFYVLFTIITSLLFNLTEMGNSSLNEWGEKWARRASMLTDKAHLTSSLSQLRASTVNLFREIKPIYTGDEGFDMYRRGATVDENIYNQARQYDPNFNLRDRRQRMSYRNSIQADEYEKFRITRAPRDPYDPDKGV